jgi:tetratricopeptide (TPR) repeat protein
MFEKAAKVYAEALREDPGEVRALQGLGVMLAQMGRLREATKVFERLLEVQQTAENAYNAAMSYHRLGDVAHAAALYQKVRRYRFAVLSSSTHLHTPCAQAIALEPSFSEAHIKLASLYRDTGDVSKVVHHLNHAIRIEPSRPHAYIYLAGEHIHFTLMIILTKPSHFVSRRHIEQSQTLLGSR